MTSEVRQQPTQPPWKYSASSPKISPLANPTLPPFLTYHPIASRLNLPMSISSSLPFLLPYSQGLLSRRPAQPSQKKILSSLVLSPFSPLEEFLGSEAKERNKSHHRHQLLRLLRLLLLLPLFFSAAAHVRWWTLFFRAVVWRVERQCWIKLGFQQDHLSPVFLIMKGDRFPAGG